MKITTQLNSKKIILYSIAGLFMVNCSNNNEVSETKIETEKITQNIPIMNKKIDEKLPTIGVIIFEGVVMNEVIAPLDVFANLNAEEKSMFNVVLIGKENKIYNSNNGMKVSPDYLIENAPKLNVLVVPSSYTPEKQTTDKILIDFIKEQNKTTDYISSHCAGAFLIGESGIAEGKNIVTYVTGGEYLKTDYPNLKVADDSKVSVMQDGKFFSSNGSLVSYISSLDLLETMTSKNHRNYVESALLFNKLKE